MNMPRPIDCPHCGHEPGGHHPNCSVLPVSSPLAAALAALKPFAYFAKEYAGYDLTDGVVVVHKSNKPNARISVGDLVAAEKALASLSGAGEKTEPVASSCPTCGGYCGQCGGQWPALSHPPAQGGGEDEIASIKASYYPTFARGGVFVTEDGEGWTVHQWTSESVAPPVTYPTKREAASRILQLLHIGPVAPQTWPEEACISSITEDKS